jgi:hypothetical protein
MTTPLGGADASATPDSPPPPSAGWPPPAGNFGIPSRPQRRHGRRRWAITVAVIGIVAVVATVVGLVRRDDGADHPNRWDPRVTDLVAFVERERGLTFDHPVRFEFLTSEEYADLYGGDESSLTDDVGEAIDHSEVVFEALGLVSSGTDLVDTVRELAATTTAAVYSYDDETITVRGTEMTPYHEMILVHELTHAAQHQALNLSQVREELTTGDASALQALVEGDANRMGFAYVASFDLVERRDFTDELRRQTEAASADASDVPGGLLALFRAPYALGEPLVRFISAEDGNVAVDNAIESPPASSEHLVDLRAFVAGDTPVDVQAPDLPDGADRVGEPETVGPIGLFVVLSERIPPLTALRAVDVWGGDSFGAFRDGDRACANGRVVADTPRDLDELAAALREWAGAGTPNAARVAVAEDVVTLEGCADTSGDDAAEPSGRSVDALRLIVKRSQLAVGAMTEQALDPEAAAAYGHCVVERLSVSAVFEAWSAGERSAAVENALRAAHGACEPK